MEMYRHVIISLTNRANDPFEPPLLSMYTISHVFSHVTND